MEEYLNNLLDQIRCRKAHAAIREELESHISDQIEDNMKAGMTREEAEKAAVCDMGDPVTTGISLDQIHRPKMARQIIVLMAVIMFAGVLIHWMMGAPVACMQTISGFCLMFFICHLDYTRIAAIAKVIAAGIILVGIYALFFGVRFGGNIWVASLLWLRISMFSFLMLYVPVYGAILYSYYGEGYKGLVKAALWAVPPLFIALMMSNVYPAVFTPKKDGKGYDAYFPDLECCEAEGPDLEDAVENAREAAYNWISLELEEEGDLPAQTHIDDMSLPEGSMVKQIMVRIKLLPDND